MNFLSSFHKNNSYFLPIILGVIFTILAFSTRFYHLDSPKEVVFDEYHFFHFVANYEKGEYFFDIHPPLGKLLLWVNANPYGIKEFGEKAQQEKKFREEYVVEERTLSQKMKEMREKFPHNPEKLFELEKEYDALYEKYQTIQSNPLETYTIGTKYDKSIDIWGIRSMPAFFGALLIPLIFCLVFFLTRSVFGASIASTLLLFEPSLLVESRYVLMDSMLLFFMISTVLFLFIHHKYGMWKWWIAASICAALSISIKWTALSVIGLSGIFLLISLFSQWNWKVFFSKALLFWTIVLGIYIATFYIHFASLPSSGTGDVYHSTAFRQTLKENDLNSELLPKTFWTNPNGTQFFPKRFPDIVTNKEVKQKDGAIEIIKESTKGDVDWESSKLYGKFIELNRVMGDRNASITQSHPFSSTATNWMLGEKFIFYWSGETITTSKELREQLSKARKEHNLTLAKEIKKQIKILRKHPEQNKTIKTEVHLFTNPIVWIIATITTFSLFIVFISNITKKKKAEKTLIYFILFIAIISNILPYLLVTRPAFLYHAFPAFTFAIISMGVLAGTYIKNTTLQLIFFIPILAGLIYFISIVYPLIYGFPFDNAEYSKLFWWKEFWREIYESVISNVHNHFQSP